jgi:hypothetical protein
MERVVLIAAFMLGSLALGWQLGVWHGALMAQLRERHPEAWQELGSPHAAWAGWSFATLFFLLFRRFERLGDSRFSADARRFCVGFLLWIAGGLAVVVFSAWFLPR